MNALEALEMFEDRFRVWYNMSHEEFMVLPVITVIQMVSERILRICEAKYN